MIDTETISRTNQKSTYWYEFWDDWCPQCGADNSLKERVYDRPKPDEWADRHHESERWDYCD